MSDDQFNNFINQISGKNIERIIPYLNNEPFLDKNFAHKVKKIREALPNSEIEISTNVVYFDEKTMLELRDIGIDDLRLSIFGYSKNTYQTMMPTSNYEIVFKKLPIISKIFSGTKTKVSIIMIDTGKIDENEFLNMEKLCDKFNFSFCRWGFLDRAKNVENGSNNYYQEFINGCEQNRPTERMHILSNGDVIFCCQDWSHDYICGNIFSGKGCAPELCKNCKLSLRCDAND